MCAPPAGIRIELGTSGRWRRPDLPDRTGALSGCTRHPWVVPKLWPILGARSPVTRPASDVAGTGGNEGSPWARHVAPLYSTKPVPLPEFVARRWQTRGGSCMRARPTGMPPLAPGPSAPAGPSCKSVSRRPSSPIWPRRPGDEGEGAAAASDPVPRAARRRTPHQTPVVRLQAARVRAGAGTSERGCVGSTERATGHTQAPAHTPLRGALQSPTPATGREPRPHPSRCRR